ncbi:Cys/Met metabolism, pyridoxal phosphate-dependent enzyme [Metarhizium guizhouense ARSEF 977]|uniref:cystathionine gamma-lyase n=1 Tax=Metarhizium guizhouense (strain ARSEF 977) TaxID=1276136 RepID=A0A0B4GEV9_METGA|nr:Cys/Met metabolism, pyridoxal phosphate-dependent enzyme [Metarhizium guizhouense ARSEF 977]
MDFKDFATRAVHAGSNADQNTGAVIAPISLSTTFLHEVPGQPVGPHLYSRLSNPNRDDFERAIAELEKSRFAVAFSSGSAAVASILLTLAKQCHMVSTADLYGGTREFFNSFPQTQDISITFSNKMDEELENIMIPGKTKLIWVETPSNPTLKVVDISKIARMAHKHGALLAVDNTFASPYLQNPLIHGADIVVHSATKFINGHSDVVLGVIAFDSEHLLGQMRSVQKLFGAVPSPFDCWLAHRGLKTLHLRVRQASINATGVARVLENSPHVLSVSYPGLESFPGRATVLKQHRDGMGGGMLSFRIKGGRARAEKFCASTKVFRLAVSLGGVESLAELPAAMTHGVLPVDQREAADLYDDLIRLSCGVEGPDALITDILQALEVAMTDQNGV